MAFEKVQPDSLLFGDRVLTRDEADRGEPVEVMARMARYERWPTTQRHAMG